MTITVAAALPIAGCSSALHVERAMLRCEEVHEGAFCGFYSFRAGVLAPPVDPDQVDLVYYFDNNDCAEGALIGHDDRPGFIFPIGDKSWRELAKLKTPPTDIESVVGISPLTKDKEGLAFWVKARGGEYILARIRGVQPASYSDLMSGNATTLELEWSRPQRATVWVR